MSSGSPSFSARSFPRPGPWTGRIPELYDDPVLLRKSLETVRYLPPANAFRRDLEEKLSRPDRIVRILEGNDTLLADRLVRSLPPPHFSSCAGSLERWLKFERNGFANPVPDILTQVSPDDAAEAFLRVLSKPPFPGATTLSEIAEQLPRLPLLPARRIFELLLDLSQRGLLPPLRLISPGCRIGHERVYELVPFLANAPSEWHSVVRTLFSHAFCVEANYEGEWSIREVGRILAKEAPRDEIDRIRRSRDFQEALSLLGSHSSRNPEARFVYRFLEAIPPTLLPQNVEAAFELAIGATVHAFESELPDLSSLSPDDFLRLFGLGLLDDSRLAQMSSFLSRFSDEDLLRAFENRVSSSMEDGEDLVPLAAVMGRIGRPIFIPLLTGFLSEDYGEFLCETAQEALKAIGSASQEALIRSWETLEDSQRAYGASVIEAVGGPALVDFLIAHPELFKERKEEWCSMALSFPDPRLIPFLLPDIEREDPSVDSAAFLLLSLFEPDFPSLPQIRERVNEPFVTEAILSESGTPRDFLRLLLTCECCGEANYYKVSKILTGAGVEDPLVADGFPCRSCGRFPFFRMDPFGRMVIAAERMRSLPSNRKGDRSAPSLVRIVNVRDSEGNVMSFQRAVRTTMESLEKNPDDACMLNRMTNFLIELNKKDLSIEYGARAYASDPNAVEIIYNRILLLRSKGDDIAALDVVRNAFEKSASWHYLSEVPGEQRERLRNIAARLFLDMKIPLPSYLATFRKTSPVLKGKVGRNDPCSCGSGKKYKKCCL